MTIVDTALEYAARGWPVFPLRSRAKLPLTEKGLLAASVEEDQIRRWWRRWPNANIGLRTGRASGIVALDVDVQHGGAGTLAELERAHGKLPKTAEVLTGGGGKHLYFAYPGEKVRNSAGKLGRGLDVRADGGYVVAPGSVHENGRAYQWAGVHREVATLPTWLEELLVERTQATNGNHLPAPASGSDTPYGREALQREVERVAHAVEGTRNATLNEAAFALGQLEAGGELAPGSAEVPLGHAALACGLPVDEIKATLRSGLEAGRQQPRRAPERPRPRLAASSREPETGLAPANDVDVTAFMRTDVGNAELFIAQHGHNVRYCRPWNSWLIWDGRRWRADETGDIIRRARDTVRSMLIAAIEADDKGYRSHALTSEREPRIRALVSLAQSFVPVRPNGVDADPWALNVKNGTLDLRTGELRAHERDDLLTKLAPVAYDADASAPRWTAFVERIFDHDQELIAFVRRLVGMSLTGTPGAQVLPICWGGGANGKSTFLSVLQRLLGDYAHQAPPELLMLRGHAAGGATPDLADLHGRRLVATIETSEGRRLDEGLVKALTGGDAISARRLYGQPFVFQPSHTIWLVTNHKPDVRGNDLALWRRIALIRFTVTIPLDEQRDQAELIAELLEEAPGILAWAVRGCLEWRSDGLRAPDAVTNATSEYREESDVLAGFLGDLCVIAETARVKASDLYAAYASWCSENHERILSQTAFGLRLRERGFTSERTKTARWWTGVGLLNADPTLEDELDG